MKFSKIIKEIQKGLKNNGHEFEQTGNEITYAIAKTDSFYTRSCTIEVINERIYVNSNEVESVEDVIYWVNVLENTYATMP